MIWYGGDYNPEQWPEEVWDDDVSLMREAGVNLVSVGIFSWARLEPRDGQLDFEWLDRALEKLHAGGVRVDLATATASPPAWLTRQYPEVLPVTEAGVRLSPGSRQHYCPSSPVYRRYAARLTRAIAERYAGHPALEMWHINNEYGCHVSHCYCDVSAEAFRGWLESKYDSVDALNAAWGTAFWSQQYSGFDEVLPPRAAPTFRNPTQLLDFDRFSSNELLECFRAEASIVREVSPGIPVTTNFMGFFKSVDYWKWAREVDVVSDDSYPDPADPSSPAYAAMSRDLMRSLRGGQPWILMEQAPSAVNWRRRNAAKAPGQMSAWSHQAVARGADGILFFQWRQSAAGAEKFHSGMVPHAGADSRVFREVKQLGAELAGLTSIAGSRVEASVAVVVEWDSWWSIEQEAVPARLSYLQGVFSWYRQLYARNIAVDFVRADADLSGYKVVLVPSLFLSSPASLQNLAGYARGGGHLVVTYQTGIVDESARVTAGGYLGALGEELGVRIEEFAPPAPPDLAATGEGQPPLIRIDGAIAGSSGLWSEYLHAGPGTEVLARFADGPLDGWPAITRRGGAGSAWYVATMPGEDAAASLLTRVLGDAGVLAVAETPAGTEAVRRGDLLFLIDHETQSVTVEENARGR